MRTLTSPFLLLVLPLLAGSTGCMQDPWEAGTWIEEDFEVVDNDCGWADLVVDPDEPHSYTLGDLPESDEPHWDTANEIETLAEALSWIQDRSDNLWQYCELQGSLEIVCPATIQLVQPALGLEEYIIEECGSTESTRYRAGADSVGLLLHKGEARLNHSLELNCLANDQGCSIDYSSTLRRQ